MTDLETRLLGSVAGLGVCITVLWLWIADARQRRGPKEFAIGSVEDFKATFDDGKEMFAAVIRYQVGGQEFEIVDDLWSSDLPRRGKLYRLSFPAGKPHDARVERPWLRVLGYGVTLSLAVILCFVIADILKDM